MTQVLKHLPGAREQERRNQRRCQERSDERVRVIEGEEVRGDDPIEYFLPTGVGSTFGVPEGVMAIGPPE